MLRSHSGATFSNGSLRGVTGVLVEGLSRGLTRSALLNRWKVALENPMHSYLDRWLLSPSLWCVCSAATVAQGVMVLSISGGASC